MPAELLRHLTPRLDWDGWAWLNLILPFLALAVWTLVFEIARQHRSAKRKSLVPGPDGPAGGSHQGYGADPFAEPGSPAGTSARAPWPEQPARGTRAGGPTPVTRERDAGAG